MKEDSGVAQTVISASAMFLLVVVMSRAANGQGFPTFSASYSYTPYMELRDPDEGTG